MIYRKISIYCRNIELSQHALMKKNAVEKIGKISVKINDFCRFYLKKLVVLLTVFLNEIGGKIRKIIEI